MNQKLIEFLRPLLMRKDLLICVLKAEFARDNLITRHTCNFLNEPDFIEALEETKRATGSSLKGHEWRIHTALWTANHCANLEGDFVECGVDLGLMSRAIVKYIGFEKLNKKFYLLDSWEDQMPVEQATEEEKELNVYSGWKYEKDRFEKVKKAFEGYNVEVIKGRVPDALEQVKAKKVAYLSIDMNLAYPEIKALEFFWDKMAEGGMILLDDYSSGKSFEVQRKAFDDFANAKGVKILTLPTGQGLIVKNGR